jgi:N-glycosylase/DNA lyase
MTLALTVDQAVRRLCPEVAQRVEARKFKKLTEAELWRELACCVLSSQVRYETALAAARALASRNVFADLLTGKPDRYLRERTLHVLTSPLRVGNGVVHFRFPYSKTEQLLRTRTALSEAGVSLRDLVYDTCAERSKRRQLIQLVSGFGPKQASMFLRAAGVSYDLAILDTHALTFMRLLGLATAVHTRPYLPLPRYERLETDFEHYAKGIGYPLGYVDWAVWIVMRAVRELGL